MEQLAQGPARRSSKWRAVLVTFAITAAASAVVARHLVLNVFPTRAWWVKKELPGDDRERGEYLETVLYSRLSDEDKLRLLGEAFGSVGTLPVQKAEDLRVGASLLSPTGQSDEYLPGDRLPYLRQPLTDLVLRTLEDESASRFARREALYFFNALVTLARRLPDSPESPSAFRVQNDRGYSRRALAGATPALVPFLAETDLVQRQLAVRAFAAMGRPLVVHIDHPPHPMKRPPVFPMAELVACASDGDPFVRFHAVRALGCDYYPHRARVGPALLERFAKETDPMVRVEIVTGLGHVGCAEGHDPRPPLTAFLNTPRPPKPKGFEYQWGEDSPYKLDRWLRMHVLMALSRMPSTPEAVAAAKATLENMTPDVQQHDFAGLAAAAYLGRAGQGAAVLPALRWQWAERRNGGETLGGLSKEFQDFGLFTFAAAVLEDRTVGRTATSELIRLLPVASDSRLPFAIQPSVDAYYKQRYQEFPSTFDFRLWGDGNGHPNHLGEMRLSDSLERLGPPDAADLPALRALLDYDGKGVTADADKIAEVRREAAKAILRHRTFAGKPEEALSAVIADPTEHKELRVAAQELLKRHGGRR